jgi:uncharacterized protein with PQ loop repeat
MQGAKKHTAAISSQFFIVDFIACSLLLVHFIKTQTTHSNWSEWFLDSDLTLQSNKNQLVCVMSALFKEPI